MGLLATSPIFYFTFLKLERVSHELIFISNNQMREGGWSPPWLFVNPLQFLWSKCVIFVLGVHSHFHCVQ
jgi:hypothetical protein